MATCPQNHEDMAWIHDVRAPCSQKPSVHSKLCCERFGQMRACAPPGGSDFHSAIQSLTHRRTVPGWCQSLHTPYNTRLQEIWRGMRHLPSSCICTTCGRTNVTRKRDHGGYARKATSGRGASLLLLVKGTTHGAPQQAKLNSHDCCVYCSAANDVLAVFLEQDTAQQCSCGLPRLCPDIASRLSAYALVLWACRLIARTAWSIPPQLYHVAPCLSSIVAQCLPQEGPLQTYEPPSD